MTSVEVLDFPERCREVTEGARLRLERLGVKDEDSAAVAIFAREAITGLRGMAERLSAMAGRDDVGVEMLTIVRDIVTLILDATPESGEGEA